MVAAVVAEPVDVGVVAAVVGAFEAEFDVAGVGVAVVTLGVFVAAGVVAVF